MSDIDRAMLKSMAASFRGALDFSFNRHDMAELMDRCAAQPDLTQAAVAAALEGAAARLRELVPAPAGGPFSHTNTARVTALDAVSVVAALITDPQHDAMQAVIAAAKAEARAEDAAKIEAIPPLVSTLIQFINALADECETDLDDVVATVRIMPEGREVAEVSATVVIEKLQERLAQIGAKP